MSPGRVPKRALVVAIDGPSASGKGTVGRMVARQLGYRYIDTGAMYRAVALAASRAGVSWEDGEALGALLPTLLIDFTTDDPPHLLLGGEDVTAEIRTEHIGLGASRVSQRAQVRAGLVELQRRMGEAGGVVMDGRDIGTVVFPAAEVKIFLTASADERAQRRSRELAGRGVAVDHDQVARDLAERDRADIERQEAPLRQAADAVLFDTTGLPPAEVARRLVEQVLARAAVT